MAHNPLNPAFLPALKIADAIPNCANKTIRKAAILAWCHAAKKAIGEVLNRQG
jgi:hypothetical protein